MIQLREELSVDGEFAATRRVVFEFWPERSPRDSEERCSHGSRREIQQVQLGYGNDDTLESSTRIPFDQTRKRISR